MAQAVGRQMAAQGEGGSIIQTSSTYGLVGPDFRIYEGSKYLGHQITTPCFYATSKTAVIGLTRYLATYWAKQGIRVNTLVPGGVESGQNEQFQKLYGERTPLERMAHVDEIVGTVVYLASDASSYMTGQMMVVDGGWTAWEADCKTALFRLSAQYLFLLTFRPLSSVHYPYVTNFNLAEP